MEPLNRRTEFKSSAHGGLFEVDDRFRAWTSFNLEKMLTQIYNIGHPKDTHFLYLNTARETYKRREDPKMRALFKKIAIEHISIFDTLSPVLYNPINNLKPTEVMLPSVPTFQYLATVYTEEEEYEKAIGVCEKAINVGLEDYTNGDYQRRIERIKKKAAKQGKVISHCDCFEIDALNKARLLADIEKGYSSCRKNALQIAKEKRYDLVMVTFYPTECSKCKPFQGRTFSINGKDPDFAPLSNAIKGGLFHEGCHHLMGVSPD